ncbi:malto-oligosyltrehalose trehalohydrolase [Caenispirillum bisanense]|uniref:Malto-oligosyltrehalose trehalohydrolase n=1 Tax=Caenispirillum bisanense TaxID=414052 RepID=A0A286G431_9PROT|nr:malto-oligosyltrehalose trehalohydrolase [Caenispirillum bisanense]SOD89986.1 maltooligosyl trehalose hydrolase [Caenispirillum bisanense]
MRDHHSMPFGAELTPDGCRFRLWAPDVDRVTLCIEGPGPAREIAATPDADGWVQVVEDGVVQGTRYRWRLPDGLMVPDPASRYQPEDVHGPSEVIDPLGFQWTDQAWEGRPWDETVIYELHVGTFTPEGTFRAAIDQLDYLTDLGVTAVELMPVADFPGRWDWGYDGVHLFAPDAAYGHPDDLKALIDACHARGLQVFMDVVYNHFGPEGNYLHALAAKRFFDAGKHTPWGAAIAFDGPHGKWVSDFFVHNALYWVDEFHIDGLRLDAVHAIHDDRDLDVLDRIAEAVHGREGGDMRHIHLVLENDLNAAHRLTRDDGRATHYVAQWNDDSHHALHCLLTGESGGYYGDYAADPAAFLTRILAEGFAYQGEPSRHRGGEARGERSGHLPPTSFVNFLQNHDQIGNRAMGERIDSLARPEAVMAAESIVLLAPAIPLLFQGEEWGSRRPFLFFCDFGEDLHEAVRDGRRAEFESFPEFRDPEARKRIPDPMAEETFRLSKLDWSEATQPPHADRLAFTKALLSVRRHEIVPRLPRIDPRRSRAELVADRVVTARWGMEGHWRLSLLANLSDRPVDDIVPLSGRVIWTTNTAGGRPDALNPWAVVWAIEDAE